MPELLAFEKLTCSIMRFIHLMIQNGRHYEIGGRTRKPKQTCSSLVHYLLIGAGLVTVACIVSEIRCLTPVMHCTQWEYMRFFKMATAAKPKVVRENRNKLVHPPSFTFQMALVWALQHARAPRSIG